MYNFKVTVFTPAFNRGYIIEELYKSLKRQTCKDFEWLVVDDGSEDNTEELFVGWKAEDNGFPIRYYKKENGGKHRAINYALDLAEGELFYIVDSDDILTDNAIERIIKQVEELPVNERTKYAGVCNLRGYSLEKIMGTTFEGEYLDCTPLERESHGITGDKAEVIYTSVFKKYPFPEYEGEKFITESIVWDRIANDGYCFRFFNEINYLCEYREDGLTQQGMELYYKNPKGYGLYLRQCKEFNKYSRALQEYFEVQCYLSWKDHMDRKTIGELLGSNAQKLACKAFAYTVREKASRIKQKLRKILRSQ